MTTTSRLHGAQAASNVHFSPSDANHFAVGLLRVAAEIALKACGAGRPNHGQVVSLGDLDGEAFDEHVDHAFARLEQGLR